MIDNNEKMIDEYIDNHKKEVDTHVRNVYRKKELINEIEQYYYRCLFLEPFKVKYFKDFDVNKQGEEAKETMQLIKEVGEQFVSQIDKGEIVHGLFHGKSGRGKTFLSQIIMCECVKHFKKCLFFNALELKKKFRRKEAKEEYLKYIENADLVILDELGAEVDLKDNGDNQRQANNRWQQDLYYLFSICENKNLIVTTNHTPEELSLIYNPNLYSRLQRHLKNTGSDKIKHFALNFNQELLAKDLRFED